MLLWDHNLFKDLFISIGAYGYILVTEYILSHGTLEQRGHGERLERELSLLYKYSVSLVKKQSKNIKPLLMPAQVIKYQF